MDFTSERDRILGKLTHRSRTVSPTSLKHRLNQAGFSGMCLWCGKELSGRRTSWCSDECSTAFYIAFDWASIRASVIRDQEYRCADCGEKSYELEVHHIDPVRAHGGSGDPFDKSNLIAVCYKCHNKRHKELRSKHKITDYLRKKKLSTLDVFGVDS